MVTPVDVRLDRVSMNSGVKPLTESVAQMACAARILAFKVPDFFFVVERNQGCAQRSITAVAPQPLQRLIDIEGLGLLFEKSFVAL